MDRQNRTQLILGVLLVLAGVLYFLAPRLPWLEALAHIHFTWPVYVIGAGVLI